MKIRLEKSSQVAETLVISDELQFNEVKKINKNGIYDHRLQYRRNINYSFINNRK